MPFASPHVLVLGATSEIASHVARIYAARGARLHLVGRSAEKLGRVAETCAAGNVSVEAADLAILESNAGVVERAIAALGHLDVALIAHGDLGDQLLSEHDFSQAEATLRVNLLSAVSLVVPLANYFEAAGCGTLGVITSVAGERGRPRNYTYGAAKGGLNHYLEGVRSRLYPSGAKVTTLKLGPVHTPMTVDHPKNALFAEPDAVARSIVRALDAGKAEVFVPHVWAWIMQVVRWVPEPLFQRLGFLSGR